MFGGLRRIERLPEKRGPHAITIVASLKPAHYAALRSGVRERLDFAYSGCAIFSSDISRVGIVGRRAMRDGAQVRCRVNADLRPCTRAKSAKRTALCVPDAPYNRMGFAF
jgi:hypothetical protein